MPDDSDRSHWTATALSILDRLVDWNPVRDLSQEKRSELRGRLDELRAMILRQRAPRIAVVGSSDLELPSIVHAITGRASESDESVHTYLGRGRWYDWNFPNGALQLLDVRRTPDDSFRGEALERQSPDVVFLPWVYDDTDGEDFQVADAERLFQQLRTAGEPTPKLVAGIVASSLPDSVDRVEARHRLRRLLRDSTIPETDVSFSALDNPEEFSDDLLAAAPPEASLQLARLVAAPSSRKRIAREIIRSSAGIAAALASMPLPVADIVPITGVQLLMVGTIGHLGGRKFRLQTVGEFAAAFGVNIGAGYAFREIVRAVVQFVPFAGAVVSSGIAAGATFAIGNAAVSYFIDDTDDFDAAPKRVKDPGWDRHDE